jgi:hypothetical protein
VLLPLVTEDDLDAGAVEGDPARGAFTFMLDVTAEEGERWSLYIRSDRITFSAESLDKSCSDLEWKLDEAPASTYRSLDEHDALVLTRTEGGNMRVAIDVRVRVDWLAASGRYELPVLLRAAPD